MSDVHYGVDLWALALDGISGLISALDHIRDSVSSQDSDSHSGLVVFYSAGHMSRKMLQAISLHSGRHPSSRVKLAFWIATHSLSALPVCMRRDYRMHFVKPKPGVVSWREKAASSVADALVKEIKADTPNVERIRRLLYRLNTATLSIHDLSWPLLLVLEKTMRACGRDLSTSKLLDYTATVIKILNESERGYRPIFYLERLVVETAIVFHEQELCVERSNA